jgi:hypothetical protein
MKTTFVSIFAGILLGAASVLGQPGLIPGQPGLAGRPANPGIAPQAGATLAKFDLDFPGGTPRELIKAIERSLGQPVNAIIPEDQADVRLPALKMVHVDLVELFRALQRASMKTVTYVTGTSYGGPGGPYQQYQQAQTSYGFQTESPTINENSIWYFRCDKPILPPAPGPAPKTCRFYQLGPYLKDRSVDDITTAIQTGWKMLRLTEVPEISFHRDTSLLIAVGEAGQLKLIEDVLAQLSEKPSQPNAAAFPAKPPAPDKGPVPGDPPKAAPAKP